MNAGDTNELLTYSVVEALYKKGLVDKKFFEAERDFNSKIEILRYSEVELTAEKLQLAAQIEEFQRRDEEFRRRDAELTLEIEGLTAQADALGREIGWLSEEKGKAAQALHQARADREAFEREVHTLRLALQDARHSKAAELDAVMQQLSAIQTSSTWRMTRGLRRVLTSLPAARRLLRRSAKLVLWTATFQLPRRYHQYVAARRAIAEAEAAARKGPPDLSHLEISGCYNTGWYGGRRLKGDELFAPATVSPEAQAASDERRAHGTERIIALYDPNAHSPALDILRQVAPTDLIRERFSTVPPAARPRLTGKPRFSIVTPFHTHIDFFARCAASVDAVMAAELEAGRVEWIVVNDDPAYGADDLLARVPARARDATRILSDGRNKGIAARTNEACATAMGDWLLFLDCDDELEAKAVPVLDHYVARFPDCRYISSGLIDIDEEGAVLRFRANSDPTWMFQEGMTVGHLKAIRRDLFRELGGCHAEHSGCQDYDFALRTSLNEPILCIPDYLYRYRWHRSSQSVSRKVRQATNTILVLRDFLRLFADLYGGRTLRPTGADRAVSSGLCLIRTQGARLELLAEAVASVLRQELKVTPCVLVHGGADSRDKVVGDLAARGLDAEVIQAPVRAKKRGYPLNVGLAHLRQNPEKYDFVCLLDDDDILYPFFSTRLAETMNLTDCDVAVSVATSRVPWERVGAGHTLKPWSALVAGNFITNHSYIARTSFLLENDIWFDETLHYLEDWDFLVSLYRHGARFESLPEALCEYRIIGDGNREQKANPTHYEYCAHVVMKNARAAAAKLGLGRYLRDLAAFDFQEQPPYPSWEIGHLLDSRGVFLSSPNEWES